MDASAIWATCLRSTWKPSKLLDDWPETTSGRPSRARCRCQPTTGPSAADGVDAQRQEKVPASGWDMVPTSSVKVVGSCAPGAGRERQREVAELGEDLLQPEHGAGAVL